jgi:hypothetical protein
LLADPGSVIAVAERIPPTGDARAHRDGDQPNEPESLHGSNNNRVRGVAQWIGATGAGGLVNERPLGSFPAIRGCFRSALLFMGGTYRLIQ